MLGNKIISSIYNYNIYLQLHVAYDYPKLKNAINGGFFYVLIEIWSINGPII